MAQSKKLRQLCRRQRRELRRYCYRRKIIRRNSTDQLMPQMAAWLLLGMVAFIAETIARHTLGERSLLTGLLLLIRCSAVVVSCTYLHLSSKADTWQRHRKQTKRRLAKLCQDVRDAKRAEREPVVIRATAASISRMPGDYDANIDHGLSQIVSR